MFFDVTDECGVRGLVAAAIDVILPGPATCLPIRDLAALDRDGGALPPHHARHEAANGSGGRAGAEVFYAHSARTPTSALVEAKIFSPSLTLSYTDSAVAKNGSFGPLDNR